MRQQTPVVDLLAKTPNIPTSTRTAKAMLPIDAVILADGIGVKRTPWSIDTPQSLLRIGDKPLISYMLELMSKHRIPRVHVGLSTEENELSTYIGQLPAFKQEYSFMKFRKTKGSFEGMMTCKDFQNDYILAISGSVLTNLNIGALFHQLIEKNADMVIATIPYPVEIDYDILGMRGNIVTYLKPQPAIKVPINGGICLFKRSLLKMIPRYQYLESSDFTDLLLNAGKRIVSYSIQKYWLDIRGPQEYKQAQNDVLKYSL